MPRIPTPEEMAKINEERESYAKSAKNTASNLNSAWENITGKGMTADAVMATDAKIEDELREIGSTTFLKMLNDSSLILNFKEHFTQKGTAPYDHVNATIYDVIIEGELDGQHIQLFSKDVLTRSLVTANEEEHRKDLIKGASLGAKEIGGKINGKMISKDLARKIWQGYYHAIALRTDALEKTKKDLK